MLNLADRVISRFARLSNSGEIKVAESMVELENKLSDMRKHYVDGMPARLANIEERWQALKQGVVGEQREALVRMVHSIAGSGAIYGFTPTGEAARSFEKKLVEICAPGGLPTPEQSTVRNIAPGCAG